jgi:hypothetical protein
MTSVICRRIVGSVSIGQQHPISCQFYPQLNLIVSQFSYMPMNVLQFDEPQSKQSLPQESVEKSCLTPREDRQDNQSSHNVSFLQNKTVTYR